MAHLHNITDTDKRFYIDPITRAVIPDSDNVNPIQFDNNSVRFVFEVPRFVGGHDMSLCDKIEIHYINFASATEKSEDVYLVDDIAVDEWADDKASFTWLLSANATKYAGPLDFLIRFICLDGDTVIYAWHTDICKDISVCDGINNSAAAIELGTDILEAWRKEVLGGSEEAAKRAEDAATKAEAAAEKATERVEEAVQFATDKVETATNEAADRAEAAAEAAAASAEAAAEYDNRLKAIEKWIEDEVNYEPIKFNSFNMEPSTTNYQHGDEVTSVKLTWELSRTAKSIKVNDVEISNTATEYEATGPFTTDQSWKVVATDEKGAQASVTKSITFYYESIKFNSFNMEPSTTKYEHGDAVASIKLKWELNRTATKITVNGKKLEDPTGTEYEATGPFTTDQSWTVVVTGEKGETATKTTGIDFYYYRVYWGLGTKEFGFDDTFITNLSDSEPVISKNKELSFAKADNQYVYYAFPEQLYDATPKFDINDDGFIDIFASCGTVSVKRNGVTINYYLYRSTNLLVSTEPFKVVVK